MRHQFKSWPGEFQQVIDGTKRFEIRKADRSNLISVGDELNIVEYNPEIKQGGGGQPEGSTGREILVKVDSVLHSWLLPLEWGLPAGFPGPGKLSAGYTVASITIVTKGVQHEQSEHDQGAGESTPGDAEPEAVHGGGEGQEYKGQGSSEGGIEPETLEERLHNSAVDLAEEHWAWLGGVIEEIGGKLFLDGFIHGHKHGVGDRQREYRTELGKAIVAGGSERMMEILTEALGGK